jgi:hypothetical protein
VKYLAGVLLSVGSVHSILHEDLNVHYVHAKATRALNRGIKKWFPGIQPKALQMLTKVCLFEGNVM